MIKKITVFVMSKEKKKKKRIRRRQRKTPPSYIEKRKKKYPREYKKHTEIITKNITINNLPTPNRYLFFGRKKTMKRIF